ncbi:MAG: plastocyanin/azurin family copper-binding protein [Pseudomonadota bacterium]
MHTRRTILGAAGLSGAALAWPVSLSAADTYTIRMTTSGAPGPSQRMRFEPDLLVVAPGSTIRFVPSAPGHNSQTTPGMLPVGAATWRIGFGKPGTVTLSQPGYYGYHCLPHRSLGMVGLIIVTGEGMRDNLAAARAIKHPGKAQARWDKLWARAKV